MIPTFEDFLKIKHSEDYHGTDDDMPDAFDAWVSEMQVDDLIQYADEWMGDFKADIMKNVKELDAILSQGK